MRFVTYRDSNRRSRLACGAAAEGVRRLGIEVDCLHVDDYVEPTHDVAVICGRRGRGLQVYREYREAGRHVVQLDLGYWRRTALPEDGGRYAGYMKVSVDHHHPTAYFQRRKHPPDRFAALGVSIRPRRGQSALERDGVIILAGMSAKGAWVYDMVPEEWERRAVARLRAVTSRSIIYRPKPSWAGAGRIEGTTFGGGKGDVEDALAGAWAVVTHHSNVAVDAVVAGVPVVAEDGVGLAVSPRPLESVEDPWFPAEEERMQFLYDVAYCQWTMTEIADGLAWRHLLGENVL